MQTKDFDHMVKAVLGDTPPRVWSLLVTIFGDLALSRDARLSGASINALTAAIGIKPEATRVALHRLRKDRWIESHRTGRQSRYALTAHGRAETLAARPRVYATTSSSQRPAVVIDKSATVATSPQTVQISAGIWVQSAPVHSKTAWVLPITDEIPDWVREKLCPVEAQLASQRLARGLTGVDTSTLSPLQATALRSVVVHEWRRLILRVPDFPDTCFPSGWKGAQCRAALADLLAHLPAPSPEELNELLA